MCWYRPFPRGIKHPAGSRSVRGVTTARSRVALRSSTPPPSVTRTGRSRRRADGCRSSPDCRWTDPSGVTGRGRAGTDRERFPPRRAPGADRNDGALVAFAMLGHATFHRSSRSFHRSSSGFSRRRPPSPGRATPSPASGRGDPDGQRATARRSAVDRRDRERRSSGRSRLAAGSRGVRPRRRRAIPARRGDAARARRRPVRIADVSTASGTRRSGTGPGRRGPGAGAVRPEGVARRGGTGGGRSGRTPRPRPGRARRCTAA